MTEQQIARVKRAVIRKYPIFASIALLNVPIIEDKNISTAAVYGEKNEKGGIDLKGIKYNSDFFDSLTFEQQVFVMAHETCHIAFKHFERSLDKPEKDIQRKYEEYCKKVSDETLRKIEKVRLHRKYNNFWNIATDACINAFLKKDGLEMPDGIIDKRTGKPMNFINIADGLYRRAELIYDALVKKDEEEQKNKNKDNSDSDMDKDSKGKDSKEDSINDDTNKEDQKNNSSSSASKEKSNGSDIGGDLDDIDIDNYEGIDSHEQWASKPKETLDKEKQKDKDSSKPKSLSKRIKSFFERGKENKKPKQKNLDNVENNDEVPEILTDEASVFEENKRKLNEKKEESINNAFNNITEEAGCSHLKPVKPILSWKQLLLRSVEEEVQRWGYRRANRYMPNARVEDISQDDKATTEIILDTSGSISDELLRGFLRQLVPLFKETNIKVGCFGGYFHGFTELKSIKQIEEFKATRDKGGTNYEAAATAFTNENKEKRINKIVFTDGQLDILFSHVQKTKVDDIIWIVFGDKMDFKPLGGKIIRVNEKDLNEMLGIIDMKAPKIKYTEQDSDEISRKRR